MQRAQVLQVAHHPAAGTLHRPAPAPALPAPPRGRAGPSKARFLGLQPTEGESPRKSASLQTFFAAILALLWFGRFMPVKEFFGCRADELASCAAAGKVVSVFLGPEKGQKCAVQPTGWQSKMKIHVWLRGAEEKQQMDWEYGQSAAKAQGWEAPGPEDLCRALGLSQTVRNYDSYYIWTITIVVCYWKGSGLFCLI